MEGRESYFLDMIPSGRGPLVRGFAAAAEEKKLELRLGPPGECSLKESCSSRRREMRNHESLLSLGTFSAAASNANNSPSAAGGAKRGFLDVVHAESGATLQDHYLSLYPSTSHKSQQLTPVILHLQSVQCLPVLSKESSQVHGSKPELNCHDRKATCPAAPAAPAAASGSAGTAGATSSQTRRNGSVAVVGWPPIRSFRKNIASSSPKPPESQDGVPPNEVENSKCSKIVLFVKVNMDGVPIGRKIDLKAYDCYEKLSCAVDELFRGLLAVQGDSHVVGNQNNPEDNQRGLKGLLDGSGDYTLVYEDNEGDRMLVGDVPWHMFVTTVKRLRVLKTSELSYLQCGTRIIKNLWNEMQKSN